MQDKNEIEKLLDERILKSIKTTGKIEEVRILKEEETTDTS